MLQAVGADPIDSDVALVSDRLPERSGYTPAIVQAMQRAMIGLFAHWGVRADDSATLLGGISSKTFADGKTAITGA